MRPCPADRGKQGEEPTWPSAFAAPRHARLALALVAFSHAGWRARRGCAAAAAAAAGGDAVGSEGRRAADAAPRAEFASRRRAASPAAGFHDQANAGAARPHARLHGDGGLDPPVRRQGRAAGRHRLHRLSARRRGRAHPAGDLPLQWRAGRGLGLAAIRRCRTLAAADQRRRGDVLRVARSAAQRRDLARLHRSRLHRSGRHRLQPLRRDRR